MKKSRYSEEQISYALKQAETGTPVAEVLRRMGISEQTFYRWRSSMAVLVLASCGVCGSLRMRTGSSSSWWPTSAWTSIFCRKFCQKTYGPPRLQVGFYGVLSSLRQRMRSRERAHGQDGHPRIWSLNKDFGIKCHFFDRAFQMPIDCQAIFTILPANLVGYAREGAPPI